MSKFSKGHSYETIDGICSQVNPVIHVSSSISWPSFKLLGQILCEISCWQGFIYVFSKKHNSRKGDNSDKKTNTGQPFFIKKPYMKFQNPFYCTSATGEALGCQQAALHGLRRPGESIWSSSTGCHLVGNAQTRNWRVVGASGPVHVQGCEKQGKSRRWVQRGVWCWSGCSSGLWP